MVAQPAGVDRRRDEVVAERVHRHQRRQADGVAVVVGVDALGQRRARRRLGADEARRRPVAQVAAQPRERQPGEVRAAADAADHDVGLLARHLHLGDRLLADHGLVQAARGSAPSRARSWPPGPAPRPRPPRRSRSRASRSGGRPARGRTRSASTASGARSRPTSRSSSAGRASGRRTTPTMKTSHSSPNSAHANDSALPHCPAPVSVDEPLDPRLRVLVGLRDGRVGLVRPGRRDRLVLVVDVRRGVQARARARRARRSGVGRHACRPRAPASGISTSGSARDLLQDQGHREDRRQVGRPRRLLGLPGFSGGSGSPGRSRRDVDPVAWGSGPR